MRKLTLLITMLFLSLGMAWAQTPFTDGALVTFTNVQHNGTTYALHVNNGALAIGEANKAASEYGNAAKFLAIQKDGKWAFRNVGTGDYMIWRGNSAGHNSDKGVLAEYNSTYCEWEVKMGSQDGLFRIVSKRSDGSTAGSIVILKNGSFDAFGDSNGFVDGHSNQFRIEVTDHFGFEPAKDYASIKKWYFLTLNKFYLYNDGTTNEMYASKNAVDTNNKDAYTWAFIGNPFDGYKVVNKKGGYLNCTNDGAIVGTEDNHTFTLTVSTYHQPNGFFMAGEGKQRFNRNGGSGKIVYWSDADGGSTFNVTERNFAAELQASIEAAEEVLTNLGNGETVGYITAASKKILSDAISNAKADVAAGRYDQVEANLNAAINAERATIQPETDKYYMIVSNQKNYAAGGKISVGTQDNGLIWNSDMNVSKWFKFVDAGNDKFYLYNVKTGLYLSTNGKQGSGRVYANATTTADAKPVTITNMGKGNIVKIVPEGGDMIHAQKDYNHVVAWVNNEVDGASAWTIVEVENPGVAYIDNTNYATLQAAIDAWTEGKTINLLANIDDAIVLPKGMKLDVINLNGFTAPNVTEAPTVAEVATLAELQAALAAENELPIIITAEIVIPEGTTVELDLNGKTVNSVFNGTSTTNHIYALRNKGTLTINDSKGNGSINSRGIYNYGSLTLNAGAINAIDGNGGYAVNNQSGSTFVMNGGVVAATTEDDHQSSSGGGDATALKVPADCKATLNGGTINDVCDFTYAIEAKGTLNIPKTSTIIVNGTHGAIYVGGGVTTIDAGTFQIPADNYSRTDNVLYVTGGSLVVNGGTFIGDSDTAAGGSCLWDEAGKAVVNGGTFKGSSGGDVWGTTGTTIKGGTFENLTEKKYIAAGYELGADGTVVAKPVAEVNGVKYISFAAAAADAQAGSEIKLLADIDGDIEVPAGVTLNGNGFAVNGVVTALGEITFAGVTKATNFGVANTSTVVNIPAGASLQLTGTGRMVIGHGCTFNITGAIADNAAKTADKATLVPSLVMPGASFTGAGVTFNVTNAYISAPSSYCSSSKSASGTFDFNINNSIWENAGKLAFESQSTAATVNFDLVSSVLNTGSHLVFGVSRGEVVIDDSNVNVGKSNQIENQSTMTIKNGSVVNGAVATSSNAKNPGTIIVENATYAVTGEFSGSDLGTGTLIIKKGANVSAGSITKANIQVDATDMVAGDEINFTANLSKLAGTLEVINNDKLEAQIVDGKVVLAAKPVAKIDEQGYATLEAAFAAATEGQTITLMADATPALTSQRAITKAAVIDLGGKTMTLTEDDLYFGTTTFKNGTIVVDPSVKPSTAVFWMFANQTLTFDAVKIVATGVTGTYLIGLDGNNSDLNIINGSEILVENTTALDLDIICVNASTGNDIKVENSKVNVTNLDGRVFFRGNYTVKDSEVNLAGITKAGFRIEAGQTLAIEGTSKVNIEGEPRDGGIHLTDLSATYTKAETATVTATVNEPKVAKVGENTYRTLAEALAAAKAANLSDVVITIIGENTAATADKFNLYQASVFNKVTFKQENGNKPYYFEELYTGSRTDNGQFVFDGVNLVVTGQGQYIFEGNVVLSNNSLIKSTAEANCFVYNAEVTVEAGSKIDGVIEDIRGGSLIIDGGKTDGTYCETPGLRDAILVVNWAKSNLVLRNGAYVNINAANEIGRLTVTGTLDVTNSKLDSYQWIEVNGSMKLNAGSLITTQQVKGAGNITIDATGMVAGDVNNFKANLANFAGTLSVINNDKLEASIVDGKIVLVAKPVAKIGEQGYATLEEAFKAATSGCTIDILSDVTIDSKWDCRYTGAKFTVPVTINGNGKTIKFTASVNDNNWNTVFRFEENATVNNLTVDISNATGAQRVISAKKSLNVDGLNIVGAARYGVIYGEGASATDLAATKIVVKNSTLGATRRAVSDNEGGKDVKSVVIESNTFNANVYVSASESIAFNNNTVAGETDLRSYAADNVLNVQAQGNTLATDKKNYIYAKTIEAQTEFATKNPPLKVATKAELNAALAAAQEGDVITLTADIDYGTDQLAIAKAITLDLGGKVLTTRNAWGGMSIKGNPTVKNGTIVHASNTAAIKVWNATAFEDLVIDVQGKGDANKTIGGIVLQSGSTTRVGSIKNVTIKGAALTNGIETYNCGDATENVIGAMENVTIEAQGTGMLISAPCGTATNCDIKGGTNGIEIFIKGNYSASLNLEGSKVEGGVYAHDEFSSNPEVVNNGTLKFTADEQTTGAKAEDVTLTLVRAEENVQGVLKEIVDNAQAKVNDTYHATLTGAIAAAKAGDKVTVFEGTYTMPSMKAGITVVGEGKVLLEGTLSGTLEKLTLKNLHIKGGNAQRWAYAKGELVFENVTFEATSVYALHFDGIAEGTNLNYKGCTIIGWAAMGGSPASCVFDGCTIKGNGTYGVIRTYFDATINNCTFDVANVNTTDAYQDGIHAVDGAEVTVTDCTNKNGDMEDLVNVHGASVVTVDGVAYKNVAKVGDKYYATFAEAYTAAKAGETVTMLADLNMSEILVLDKAITLDGNGNKLTSTAGRAINVSGADGVTIKNLTINTSGERAINVIQNATNVTIDNVTATAANYTVNVASSAPNAVVAINNSTLNGLCTVNVAAAGANVTVDNSTVNCNDNNTTVGESYAALNLNKEAKNGKIIATNTTVYVAADSDSEKARNSAEGGVVTINGSTEGVAVKVAVITYEGSANYYSFETLAAAVEFAKAGDVVTLIRDITASDIITINKAITLDGNDKTLTSTAGRAINVSGADGVTIKNLTINASGERAINVIQGATNVTIDNVTATAANYTVNVASSAPEAVVAIKNSTLNGLCTVNVSAAGAQVTVDNSTVNCNDNNTTAGEAYAALSLNKEAVDGSIVATNSTINVTDGSDSMKGRNGAENGTVTINGSTEGVAVMVAAITYQGSDAYHAFATLEKAIEFAKAGDVVTLIRDVTMDYNARDAYATQAQNVVINGNGKKLTLNQKNSDWASFGLANNSKLVLNNMTIEKTGYGDTNGAWNTHAIIFSCPVEMTDVTVNNSVAVQAGATLNNVTINEAGEYYGLWINGNGQTVTINGGAIKATKAGRGIKIADQYIDAPEQVILNVTGTKFTTAKKAAVLVTSTAGANITATNVDITEVEADNQNMVWVDEDRAANYGAVTVTGAAVAQEKVESFPIIVKNGDKVVSYFKNLDELFDNVSAYAKVSNVTVELTGDVVATKVVKTNSLKTYNFVTKVAEGVTMDMQYADDWNYFRKVNIGENVTVKCKYMVFSTETTIAGTVDAYYPYINGGKVTVAETGTLKYEGGDALQVKGKGAVLTVNGTVNAPTINVWGGNAQLVVSGANAKVESNWIDIWDGTPSVAINNGATIKTKKIKVSRGGEITITDANLLATESIEVGHNGNSAGKLTETGNSTITGEIKMTATGSTVASDGGLNVTTQIEGYTVVFDTANKLYKVVAIGDVAAKIGNSYYETLAAAITAAQANDVITFVNDITEDVTISKSITIDGAGKKYTGNIQVKGGSAAATIKNVNFVNGSGYAVTTNTINNITIENCTVTGYKYGFLYANKSTATITVKDVTIDGGSYGMNWNYGTTATLENVVMTNVTYGIHTRNYGAKTFTINNCNIDATTPIYIDEKGTTRQTFAFEGVNNLGKTLAELSLSQYAVIKGANVGKFYGTLQSMVAKAENGQTVKLLSDITMKTSDELASCDGYPSFIHLEGKAVTVDLNGKAITATASAEELAGKMLVGVFSTDKGGEFTLADSSAEGTGSVTLQANDAKVYSLLCNYNPGCKITVNGGTYTADKVSDCLIFSGAQVDDLVTINGGNFTLGNVGTGENGKPWIFNVLGSGDNHVLVKGGTFNADINRQHWSNEVVVPETHYTVANADGTYTVKEGAVAYVNEGMLTGPYFIRKNIGYATLAEAVAAVDTDETVTMLKDVTLEETLTITADKKNITLDLNGKTVSQTKAQTAGYQMILNDGELTIDDSSEAKTGKISYTDSGNGGEYISDVIYNRATLVINGGTIENLSSATVASNGYPHAVDTYSGIRNTSVTINGGTIYCAEYSAIRMFCVSATYTADLVINGGNVKGAIDMQNGTKVAALGSLSITGGIFETTKNANNIRFANWNGGATEYGITASITGGDFYGGITTQYVPAAANWNKGIISGGTFANDMTEYCATDFRCVANSDGRYIVERFGFHIVDGELTEFVNAKDVEDATITYERELWSKTAWNPLYVPFEIPVEMLIDNYHIAYLNDVHSHDHDEDGEIDEYVMEHINVKKGTLRANFPYLIYPKNEAAKSMSIVLENVTLFKAEETTVKCSSVFTEYAITGTYKELTGEDFAGKYALTNKGAWKMANTSNKLDAFRFYMTITDQNGQPVIIDETKQSIRIVVRGEEGTTDIEGVEFNTNGEELIFDLQGRRVLEPKKGGIYIINGKKVYYNK